MQTRRLENIGVDLPLLTFGGMRMPTKNGKIDVPAAQEMVDFALKNGIRYFDTAYGYHEGESESFFGETLTKYPRDSYYLATKLPVWMADSLEDCEKIFENQMKKTRADYFDFYLLHSLDKEKFQKVQEYGAYEMLLQKKKEGKIRHLGFSFHDTADVLEEILNTYEFDFVQIQFNYIDWFQKDAQQLYEVIEKKNLPIFVMEPARGGFLASLPKEMEAVLKAANPEASIASWAFRWVASFPLVKTILSGMSNMEQVADNIKTLSDPKPFTPKEEEALKTVVKMIMEQPTIPCTGCSYCMDCPNGVQIPTVFKIYNDYIREKNLGSTKKKYFQDLDPECRADCCISCGVCLEKCPQQISIPEQMALVDSVLSSL